ncbi:Rieske 2Fe-2S domain-containing protein [Tomitella fengzijianii]|uniref:Rieske 2Fe-2S domain-containing protein n=1 Tax=Tomitella fengzijianii TaxID=2597660 RepID=A0A516X2Q0_9ACTN|nr:Rieske 2Fe-2S domain-containing protein [Tomitella fengzijianii]QDQ97356.1 Rieske 2Fe-2S domain-containing protein [Tomitella fengzijianii]
MTALHDAMQRIEGLAPLDRFVSPVSDAVHRAVQPTTVRNTLSGTWLGHPFHPMLVAVPIGAWGMSALFDIVGGKQGNRAAGTLIAAGLFTAVPAAATGLNDWADTKAPESRVGAVHAAANSSASMLFLASLALRFRGRIVPGKALSWAGLALVGGGGYLGGHLTYARAMNVNHTAWLDIPSEWTRVAGEAQLPEDGTLTAHCDGQSILLSRGRSGRVSAIAATCSHMGGPLGEGERTAGCVTCPWHGSVFRLDDGTVVRGPASSPQPAYDARIVDGAVEIRSVR